MIGYVTANEVLIHYARGLCVAVMLPASDDAGLHGSARLASSRRLIMRCYRCVAVPRMAARLRGELWVVVNAVLLLCGEPEAAPQPPAAASSGP